MCEYGYLLDDPILLFSGHFQMDLNFNHRKIRPYL